MSCSTTICDRHALARLSDHRTLFPALSRITFLAVPSDGPAAFAKRLVACPLAGVIDEIELIPDTWLVADHGPPRAQLPRRPDVAKKLAGLERAVIEGTTAAPLAPDELFAAFART